jgi:hypothetical protein
MNDSLKKIKATPVSKLASSELLTEKDSIKLIQAKEPKNAFVKQTGTNFGPKQANRDWWWCDDV